MKFRSDKSIRRRLPVIIFIFLVHCLCADEDVATFCLTLALILSLTALSDRLSIKILFPDARPFTSVSPILGHIIFSINLTFSYDAVVCPLPGSALFRPRWIELATSLNPHSHTVSFVWSLNFCVCGLWPVVLLMIMRIWRAIIIAVCRGRWSIDLPPVHTHTHTPHGHRRCLCNLLPFRFLFLPSIALWGCLLVRENDNPPCLLPPWPHFCLLCRLCDSSVALLLSSFFPRLMCNSCFSCNLITRLRASTRSSEQVAQKDVEWHVLQLLPRVCRLFSIPKHIRFGNTLFDFIVVLFACSGRLWFAHAHVAVYSPIITFARSLVSIRSVSGSFCVGLDASIHFMDADSRKYRNESKTGGQEFASISLARLPHPPQLALLSHASCRVGRLILCSFLEEIFLPFPCAESFRRLLLRRPGMFVHQNLFFSACLVFDLFGLLESIIKLVCITTHTHIDICFH